MTRLFFAFTIMFMLLGPIKLIPLFSGLTRGADLKFKRAAASWGVLIASLLCGFVATAGGTLLGKYEISLAALRIAGGLVLLLAALQVIFQKVQPASPDPSNPSPLKLAVTPLAVPGIVPPAGVAAILIAMALAPQFPGVELAVAISLVIVMVLNFLVMYFIDLVLKIPGLPILLTVLGAVLIFVQAALAVEVMLNGLNNFGIGVAR